jgi:hypothetical protein
VSGRIRTIKPELLDDEKVASLSSRDFKLFIGLILEVDDYGNTRAESALLNARLWWAHPEELTHPEHTEEGLLELEQNGLVMLYEVRAQRYLHIVNWEKHQKVDHPGKPRVPRPGDAEAWVSTVSVVYFIQAGENGPIKIGRAVDVAKRMARFQTANPKKLALLGTIPNGDREREFHERFKHLRTQGEWFSFEGKLSDFLSSQFPRETTRETPREEAPRALAPDLRPPTSDPDHRPPTVADESAPPTFGIEPCPSGIQLVLAPVEPPEPAPPPPPTREQLANRVLEHWAGQGYHGRRPKLTSDRRKRVMARLAEGFTPEDLELAVEGAELDDWLMGRKEGSAGYRDVETLLRDAAQVEKLRDLGEKLRRQRAAKAAAADEDDIDRWLRVMPPGTPDPRVVGYAPPEEVEKYLQRIAQISAERKARWAHWHEESA